MEIPVSFDWLVYGFVVVGSGIVGRHSAKIREMQNLISHLTDQLAAATIQVAQLTNTVSQLTGDKALKERELADALARVDSLCRQLEAARFHPAPVSEASSGLTISATDAAGLNLGSITIPPQIPASDKE